MESVHFEKKKLVARWKSSLNAVARWGWGWGWEGGRWLALPGCWQHACGHATSLDALQRLASRQRVLAAELAGVLGAAGPADATASCPPPFRRRRDEALQAVQAALREQQEQEAAIAAEISGYRRDVAREQQRNEQLTGVLRRAEGGPLAPLRCQLCRAACAAQPRRWPRGGRHLAGRCARSRPAVQHEAGWQCSLTLGPGYRCRRGDVPQAPGGGVRGASGEAAGE
jgi:hypothetical protein